LFLHDKREEEERERGKERVADAAAVEISSGGEIVWNVSLCEEDKVVFNTE
jgi:hypothetical protein